MPGREKNRCDDLFLFVYDELGNEEDPPASADCWATMPGAV